MKHLISQCQMCKHNVVDTKNNYNCPAFPKGIPNEIIFNEYIHTKKHPDQDGETKFEAK